MPVGARGGGVDDAREALSSERRGEEGREEKFREKEVRESVDCERLFVSLRCPGTERGRHDLTNKPRRVIFRTNQDRGAEVDPLLRCCRASQDEIPS